MTEESKKTPRALIVDRDFFFVEFLSGLLSDRGYGTVRAYDGKEGLQALNEHDFQLMFVDMVMPKVDGWQVIRYTRTKFPHRPFPVIAVSGTILEQLENLDGIDADGYVAKGPLDKMKPLLNEILDKIETRTFPGKDDRTVFNLGNLYPRRESLALMETLQVQHAVLESIGFGVWVVDGDYRVLSTNSRALKQLGLSEVEVLIKPFPDLFPESERADIIDVMKRVRKETVSKNISLSVSGKNGRTRFMVSAFVNQSKTIGWIIVSVPNSDG